MDILHHGNWPTVGVLTTRSGIDMQLYECPICFALTREPIDHAYHHLRHHEAHTAPSAARVRQVGQQQ